ncbi:MAG: succinylglutamate desuccinylase/aspartoacylase family protein [Rhodospirillales bacterium]|nr:succinylglutamate desuccinylase/aspartoacylase family protein [Rhodospirillales bacterium]
MSSGFPPAAPAIAPQPGLPVFPVEIAAPDLSPYLAGNIGIPGFTCLDSGLAGPHVVLVSLIHGNEFSGAIALKALLDGGFKPLCGKLTLGFANLAAFARFDAANPIASRFVEEDMNRVWDDYALFGMRRSAELERAREIKPIIDSADILLDLHSMLWPSDPVLLCGGGPRGRALGLAVGTPALVVADTGHAGGKRLIDYGRFTEGSPQGAACLLVEAGQHWQQQAVAQSRATILAVLHKAGMVAGVAPASSGKFAEVVKLITARTNRFGFVREFRGGDIIAQAGTLIAHDGDEEIRTPEDNLIMVMPSLKVSHGHTAVRLARLCPRSSGAE